MLHQYYTLITGASEGFGKSLAIECARRKMNLILVALPDNKLHQFADSLKQQYVVDIICIEKDLCVENSCLEIYNEVKALGVRVNMLINNAGIGSTCLFEEGNIHTYERLINLNVLATTLLTRLFLDMLKQNSPSYILNVGSLASYFPIPKKQVYGASKSYIFYFSKCLRTELKKDKVFVSVICPGPLKTNMSVRTLIQSGNFFIRNSSLEPGNIASTVISNVLQKKAIMIPGKLNNLYVFVFTILPGFIKTFFTNRSTKNLNSTGGEIIQMQNQASPPTLEIARSANLKVVTDK